MSEMGVAGGRRLVAAAVTSMVGIVVMAAGVLAGGLFQPDNHARSTAIDDSTSTTSSGSIMMGMGVMAADVVVQPTLLL